MKWSARLGTAAIASALTVATIPAIAEPDFLKQARAAVEALKAKMPNGLDLDLVLRDGKAFISVNSQDNVTSITWEEPSKRILNVVVNPNNEPGEPGLRINLSRELTSASMKSIARKLEEMGVRVGEIVEIDKTPDKAPANNGSEE
ncbi:MAG: hypothetical protein RLZZ416_643 [Candidatus Parcubacteria bacterium]|jgi:hypothetical protein